MKQLVFFLEEESAKIMLEGVLPRILPEHITYKCVVFEGKQDLEKKLLRKLKGWLNAENTHFIVLHDQDSNDCKKIKQRLRDICIEAGRPETLIRIACHELESFYLGDLKAVGTAFSKNNLAEQQLGRKFRNPDELANPVEELKRLIPEYQKLAGSRKIAPLMNLDDNRSHSFRVLIEGIRRFLPI